MQISRIPTLSKVIHLLMLVGWLVAGVVGFGYYRHTFGFEFVILLWLFLGVTWFSILRWKRRAVVITPILSGILWLLLLVAYAGFTYREANQVLDGFISAAANSSIPIEFSVNTKHLPELSYNVSHDYLIESTDNYLGEYEYHVKFANGSRFFFLLRHVGLGHWNIEFGQDSGVQASSP